jgi:uncharacterized protein YndB with AHSA1/START domain
MLQDATDDKDPADGAMTQPDPNKQPERVTAGQTPDETSVIFSIDVEAPIEHAFQVFTEGIDSWWPREHHIGSVDMAIAILEPRAGGRWYELGIDESECDWGIVLAWEPPRHVALSWHLDGDFRSGTRESRVDIRFEALDDRTTRVVLEHSGLDRHGPTWRRLRDGISRGWPADLQRFARAVEHAAVTSPVRSAP